MDKRIRLPQWTWVQKAFLIAFLDGLIILAAYLMALLLRFDFIFSRIPREYVEGYIWSMPYWIAITIVVFYGCRLYHSVWRLASISELQMSIVAYIILIPAYTLGMLFMKLQMPRSYYFIRLNEKWDKDSLVFCFYNSLTLAQCEFQGRYYGGGVSELIPSEFKELPVPYRKIEKEDVEFLNRMFQEKREIDDIVAFVNSRTLSIDLGKNIVMKLEKVRKSLVKRRCG